MDIQSVSPEKSEKKKLHLFFAYQARVSGTGKSKQTLWGNCQKMAATVC